LFVRLAIELLIAGSQPADGAGFQLLVAGSKKANSYHLSPIWVSAGLGFLTSQAKP
jgi:hypothetical protein